MSFLRPPTRRIRHKLALVSEPAAPAEDIGEDEADDEDAGSLAEGGEEAACDDESASDGDDIACGSCLQHSNDFEKELLPDKTVKVRWHRKI